MDMHFGGRLAVTQDGCAGGSVLRAANALAQLGFVLSPIHLADVGDHKAIEQVTVRAKQMRLKGIEVFEKQSFRLWRDGTLLGVFVTGRTIAPNDRTSLSCFVTLVEANRRPELLMTLEEANGYITTRCGGAKAVGLIDSLSSAGDVRIGLIYDASLPARNVDGGVINPNGSETFISTIDPMVFEWNGGTHRLTIDEKSTERANSASAETLPASLKALR